MWLPVVVLAQLMIVTPPEPLPKSEPVSKPQPRVPLSATPEALFADLISTDEARRKAAADALGWEWMAGQIIGPVGLHAVNMDAGAKTERLITLDNAVAVLKQEGAEWWLVGSFSCCGPSGHAAEPFAEWKELVWSDTKDLIVHAGGASGTGVGQTNYQVYRLLRGQMFLVFEAEENAYNWRETTTTQILSTSPGKLATIRTRGKSSTCTNWQWDATKFLFAPAAPRPAKCPQ